MHRLEITGETPDALYMNVISTLALFLRGSQPATGNAPSIAEPANPPPVPVEEAVDGAAAEQAAEPAPKKRGRPAKVEAKSETMDEPLPDLTGAKPLTLDGDIRPMLRAIQKAHSERGNDMPACVAYIQKLYGPFGIAKADQLKPESFVEFMDAAKAYLDGEV